MLQNPKHLRPPIISIDGFISKYAEIFPDIHCMQIGANDGIFDDPVHTYIKKYSWKSLLIEPQRDVFLDRLTKNYAGFSNVILENCAIDSEEGEREIYKLGFTNEKWALGLTGFNIQTIQNHIDSGYVDRMAAKSNIVPPEDKKEYIVTEKVKTFSPSVLLKKHNFEKLNFLTIDTEGFDYEVLKCFDFKEYHPDVVLFESKHLSNESFLAAQEMLKKEGYKLFWEKGNTLAVDRKIINQIPSFSLLKLRIKAFIAKL